MKEYKFEPAEIVLNICMIYVHLGTSKNGEAFCLAVSKDGRSYNPLLFKQAEDVLGNVNTQLSFFFKFDLKSNYSYQNSCEKTNFY